MIVQLNHWMPMFGPIPFETCLAWGQLSSLYSSSTENTCWWIWTRVWYILRHSCIGGCSKRWVLLCKHSKQAHKSLYSLYIMLRTITYEGFQHPIWGCTSPSDTAHVKVDITKLDANGWTIFRDTWCFPCLPVYLKHRHGRYFRTPKLNMTLEVLDHAIRGFGPASNSRWLLEKTLPPTIFF